MIRAQQASQLYSRLLRLMNLPMPNTGQPDKLTRLKNQLKKAGQDRLFICLTANTACDNNRAERDLRALVLKRKRSFGSRTENGTMALSTILSLCTTTYRAHSSSYFKALASL